MVLQEAPEPLLDASTGVAGLDRRAVALLVILLALLSAAAAWTSLREPGTVPDESTTNATARPDSARCPALYLLQNVSASAFQGRNWSIAIIEPSETSPEALRTALESSGLVLAYINAGFAEEWRPYYDRAAGAGIVHGETPWYEGEHYVEYWSPVWAEIIVGQALQHLEEGYLGVYLDNIDAYTLLPDESWVTTDPRDAMKSLVCTVSRMLKQESPGALLYVNIGAATELLHDEEFTACIDGVLREELWTRWNGTRAEPVPEEEYREPLAQLEHAARIGLTVIIVDPAESREQARAFCEKAWRHGFTPDPQPAWDPDYTVPPPSDWCPCKG